MTVRRGSNVLAVMLRREWIESCRTCGECTPHSRCVVSLPVLLLALAGGGGILAAFSLPLALVLGGVSLLLLLRAGERCWRVACERCRVKRVAAKRTPRLSWPPGGRETSFF